MFIIPDDKQSQKPIKGHPFQNFLNSKYPKLLFQFSKLFPKLIKKYIFYKYNKAFLYIINKLWYITSRYFSTPFPSVKLMARAVAGALEEMPTDHYVLLLRCEILIIIKFFLERGFFNLVETLLRRLGNKRWWIKAVSSCCRLVNNDKENWLEHRLCCSFKDLGLMMAYRQSFLTFFFDPEGSERREASVFISYSLRNFALKFILLIFYINQLLLYYILVYCLLISNCLIVIWGLSNGLRHEGRVDRLSYADWRRQHPGGTLNF